MNRKIALIFTLFIGLLGLASWVYLNPVTTKEATTTDVPEKFTGEEGSFIDLDFGIEIVMNFQEKYPDATHAAFFGRTILEQALYQDEAIGIRFYYAIRDEEETAIQTLVGLGVKANQRDITEGIIFDFSSPCPPRCDPPHGGDLLKSFTEATFPPGFFTGDEGNIIDLTTGTELVRNFQNKYPDVSRACMFGKHKLESLLAQDGAVGLRFYNAIRYENSEEFQTLVVVGTRADQTDISEGLILDIGTFCPPFCGNPASIFAKEEKDLAELGQ